MSILRTFFLAAGLAALLVGSPSSATVSRPAAALTVAVSADPAATQGAPEPASDALDDSHRANALLADLKAKYRYLDGTTVRIGTTPNGEQAIAYYTEGQIVISRSHTVSLEKILAHEIWHIIDWRSNGQPPLGRECPAEQSY